MDSPSPPSTPASPWILTPHLTATSSAPSVPSRHGTAKARSLLDSPPLTPEDFFLPPLLADDEMPELDLGASSLHLPPYEPFGQLEDIPEEPVSPEPVKLEVRDADEHIWRPDLTDAERDAREEWLSHSRGRKGLRIVIVTENFLPKVDGVTRTLARLLEHLEKEGHQCMLLGPGTGMSHYASHPLVGTLGVPLVVYPGLKLNFLRPRFVRTIRDFQPDVVHFVDPIWLGAQTLMAMELGWAGTEWVSENGPALGSGIRGAVVASYHTNLATYATLFGMSWLEPIMWSFQNWLYSKTLLTLCPSPSTKSMLEENAFGGVRLWPRGVDLSQFGPSKRSAAMRASWGVGEVPVSETKPMMRINPADLGLNHQGRKVSLPITPPDSPHMAAVITNRLLDEPESLDGAASSSLPRRVVLLYVGRVSWEKNLHLLLLAYKLLASHLPASTPLPKLVFVGDGPARLELTSICEAEGYDAVFMGHRSGADLAACYASADVFAFPSFTETFGQVVLEALASGLPVIGLDAEGTRDLVQHGSTGLLLPLPSMSAAGGSGKWPILLRDHKSPVFKSLADGYSALLARAVTDHASRREMGMVACTEGIKGYTWWDAMERCVDGYRESIRMARAQRKVEVVVSPSSPCTEELAGGGKQAPPRLQRRISRVNRVVSKRLAHKGAWKEVHQVAPVIKRGGEDGEVVWQLKTLVKAIIVLGLFYAVYSHHLATRPPLSKIFIEA